MSTEETIELKSVKVLKKTGLEIGYERVEHVDGSPVTKLFSVKNDAEPVQEFQTALRLMIPHMLAILEISPVSIDAKYIKSRAAINDPKLEKFRVIKVEVSGEGDDEELVITGKKFLKFGASFEFKTPGIKLYGSEATYEFSGNLAEDKSNLFDEMEAYLGGKYTPASQLEMQM